MHMTQFGVRLKGESMHFYVLIQISLIQYEGECHMQFCIFYSFLVRGLCTDRFLKSLFSLNHKIDIVLASFFGFHILV